MNKSKAIALVNSVQKNYSLTHQNTHWANISIYGDKEGWWINIPFSKFKREIFLILNSNTAGQLILITIPANSINNPEETFRNKDSETQKETQADIFIPVTNKKSLNIDMPVIDRQSNGSGYDFSTHPIDLHNYSDRINEKEHIFPNEINKVLIEGLGKSVTVNGYERSGSAREICISHYGPKCYVCAFDFEKTYGERGKGFIHVHHIVALSEIDSEYQVDPIADLRPVCPNCHAMLHRKGNISIEHLKNEMQ